MGVPPIPRLLFPLKTQPEDPILLMMWDTLSLSINTAMFREAEKSVGLKNPSTHGRVRSKLSHNTSLRLPNRQKQHLPQWLLLGVIYKHPCHKTVTLISSLQSHSKQDQVNRGLRYSSIPDLSVSLSSIQISSEPKPGNFLIRSHDENLIFERLLSSNQNTSSSCLIARYTHLYGHTL